MHGTTHILNKSWRTYARWCWMQCKCKWYLDE